MAFAKAQLHSNLERVTLCLIREFNKHIPGPGLGVRSEVVRLGHDLYADFSRTPALVTQIAGLGGLVEVVQQPRFGIHPDAANSIGQLVQRSNQQGILPYAPTDILSFTVCPTVSYWTKGGEEDALHIRGGRIMSGGKDIDITKRRSDPPGVNKYISQLGFALKVHKNCHLHKK